MEKFPKFHLILRAHKLLLQVLIKLLVSGLLIMDRNCRVLKVTLMKFSVAPLTIRVILLLQVLKTILAKFGKINYNKKLLKTIERYLFLHYSENLFILTKRIN